MLANHFPQGVNICTFWPRLWNIRGLLQATVGLFCDWYFQGCGSAFISSGSSILGWIPIRIRIQSGSRALMTKNWRKKITAGKKIKFFGSKNTTYLSLGLHKERPSYWRSHQTLVNINFLNLFLLLWVIFALRDPDPDSESGSTDPIESGSNPDPDPDPQPWLF